MVGAKINDLTAPPEYLAIAQRETPGELHEAATCSLASNDEVLLISANISEVQIEILRLNV